MGAMASQITSLAIVYWTVYSGAGQRKLQISTSLAFVRGIHRWPVNSPHKWLVMFPFDDVIMVLPPPTAVNSDLVYAYGPGLSHGIAGQPACFTIVAKDAGAGEIIVGKI